jgi:hypothetical protein
MNGVVVSSSVLVLIIKNNAPAAKFADDDDDDDVDMMTHRCGSKILSYAFFFIKSNAFCPNNGSVLLY